jgi:hypothetical protein
MYILIFAFLKAFWIFSPESRIGRNPLYIKEIYCIFSFFFSFGAKHRGFECQNIDRAGSSASITSKSLNNKDRNVKTRNVCRPGNEKIQRIV